MVAAEGRRQTKTMAAMTRAAPATSGPLTGVISTSVR